MTARVAVFKYGVGNVFSVKSALERAGARARVVESLDGLKDYDALVLPGVGTMPAAMARLSRWARELERHLERGRPLLGICLGLQVLFEASTELGLTRGLGLLPGTIERLASRPIPHIGWSRVEPLGRSALLDGLEPGFYAYFIHSYAYKGREGFVKAVTVRGGEVFASVVERPPLYATQFHPERSGKKGLRVVRNFVEIAR